jgi:transcription elongation factor Elf1
MTARDMMDAMNKAKYVHMLLFACPECNLPVAISRVSNEKNLEKIDSEFLHIICSYCGKSSDVTAVAAKAHFVEEWP